MISRTSLVAVLALALSRTAVASFAGCYDTSVLLDGMQAEGEDIKTDTDCSTYCSSSNYTISYFTESTTGVNSSCTCSNTSPAPSDLLQASGTPSSPFCSADQIIGTYLTPSIEFNSCSYAASTTAQYISTSNSTTSCFDDCVDYPVTYIFPGAGGYNCYCAMSANGAGQAVCGDNTFYAYTKNTEASRSRR